MPRFSFRIRTLVIITALAALGLSETLAPGRRDVRATSADPTVAVRQEKQFAGVFWRLSYEQARAEAAWERRPILIRFAGVNDANGAVMEQSILTRIDIRLLLAHFVTVRLDTDLVPIRSINVAQRESLAEKNQSLQIAMTGEMIVPSFLALDERGEAVAYTAGYQKAEQFAAFLQRALARCRRAAGRRLTASR